MVESQVVHDLSLKNDEEEQVSGHSKHDSDHNHVNDWFNAKLHGKVEDHANSNKFDNGPENDHVGNEA